MSNTKGDKDQTPISEIGKFGLISRITSNASVKNKTTVSGVGDDAAVIDSGGLFTLVSTDLLLEGIHFNLVYTPLKHLGYKAIIRAISDIYAMNGTPEQVLVAIGVSSRFSVENIDELYRGIYMACNKYKVDLAGGDTSSSLTGLTISVTTTGSVGSDVICRRNGAKPNDLICVTGNFGASFMGLRILERERKLFEQDRNFEPSLTGYEYVIEKQLKPEFPSEIINDLRKAGILPSAMIDVSDGLASDLMHICKLSDTGCRIFSNRIPIHDETRRVSEEFHTDPLLPALNGGEDYELLFTVALENSEKLKAVPAVKIIGHLTVPDQGYTLAGDDGSEVELKAQGWEKSK